MGGFRTVHDEPNGEHSMFDVVQIFRKIVPLSVLTPLGRPQLINPSCTKKSDFKCYFHSYESGTLTLFRVRDSNHLGRTVVLRYRLHVFPFRSVPVRHVVAIVPRIGTDGLAIRVHLSIDTFLYKSRIYSGRH